MRESIERRYNQQRYTRRLVVLLVCSILAGLTTALVYASHNYRQATDTITSLQAEIAKLSSRPSCVVQNPWEANTTQRFILASSGGERAYNVHLPRNFSTQTSYPVIIALDGKMGNAENIERYSQFDELPVISVYPEPLLGTDGRTAWQSAPYAPEGVSDVTFIRDVLDAVERDVCVNTAQVYAVGMSNGGGLTWLLSCYMPERISAIAIVSAALYTNCDSGSKEIPILAIHGDADHNVPYSGNLLRHLPPIEQWAALQATERECNPTPHITKTINVTQFTWYNCATHAPVQLMRIHGAAHGWITMPELTKDPNLKNPTTRDVIWSFFTSLQKA